MLAVCGHMTKYGRAELVSEAVVRKGLQRLGGGVNMFYMLSQRSESCYECYKLDGEAEHRCFWGGVLGLSILIFCFV